MFVLLTTVLCHVILPCLVRFRVARIPEQKPSPPEVKAISESARAEPAEAPYACLVPEQKTLVSNEARPKWLVTADSQQEVSGKNFGSREPPKDGVPFGLFVSSLAFFLALPSGSSGKSSRVFPTSPFSIHNDLISLVMLGAGDCATQGHQGSFVVGLWNKVSPIPVIF